MKMYSLPTGTERYSSRCHRYQTLFDWLSKVSCNDETENHEEIWDDTELIRAYDRAHRQIQNRLRHQSKGKKDASVNKAEKNLSSNQKSKTKKEDRTPSITTATCPTPIPMNLITPPKDEQDAFHSMLMAWYMAGYHAGQLAAKNWKKDA